VSADITSISIVVDGATKWSVRCDEPGCDAFVDGIGSSDRDAWELALEIAARLGWQIAPDRFIRPRPDLCPDHRKGRP
jgi:hypothetical protein